MLLSNIIDKFHNNNRFTNTGTTEQTGLTTFNVWFNEINNLYTSFKDLILWLQILKLRCGSMYGPVFVNFQLFVQFINRFSKKVKNPSQRSFTNWHRYLRAIIFNLCTTFNTIS